MAAACGTSLHLNSRRLLSSAHSQGEKFAIIILFVTVPFSRSEYRYFMFLSIPRAFKTASVYVRYTMEQISIANIYRFTRRDEKKRYILDAVEMQVERPAEMRFDFFDSFGSLNGETA